MRSKTDYIVIHCAATTPNMDIGFEEIDAWHKERGWSGCGYHLIIKRNGEIDVGRPLNVVGAHVKGYNSNSVGVCMVGGIDETGDPEDNFTPAQYLSLDHVVAVLSRIWPDAEVVGHCDLNPHKDCPSFDVNARYGK